MAKAVLDQQQEQEYRIIVRHIPFSNRPRTVVARNADDAWQKFISELPSKVADPARAIDKGQRTAWTTLRNEQLAWISANQDKSADVAIVSEAEYRDRLKEIRSHTAEAILKAQQDSQGRNDDSIAKLSDAVSQIAAAQVKMTLLIEQLTKGK